MPYSELFWTQFLATYPRVLGVMLALLPVLLLVLGTIALALRLHHQREMYRLEGAWQLLGVDEQAQRDERTRARVRLQTGY